MQFRTQSGLGRRCCTFVSAVRDAGNGGVSVHAGLRSGGAVATAPHPGSLPDPRRRRGDAKSAKGTVINRRSVKHVPEGTVRVGPLRAVPSILVEHGLDPAEVCAAARVDLRALDDDENWISFRSVGILLEECAARTRCPHFGLLVGQRFELDSLGVLGDLMRNSPTVRDALRVAALHLGIHDRGAVSLTLDFSDTLAALGYSLLDSSMPAADQILDGAIAIQHRLLRALCGPSWQPVSVQISHKRPARIAPFEKYFRTRVEFDAELSAIAFDRRWLDTSIHGADPAKHRAILKAVESAASQEDFTLVEQVRRAIYVMTFTGAASSPNLAQFFGLHERTLRRRLAEQGTTARALAGAVCHGIACHLLRHTSMSISAIAALLQYSDGAVFARAFRSRSGASPGEWRARTAAIR